LVGGGLDRSAGGWSAVRALRKAKVHLKGDERILGDRDFVLQVLKTANDAVKKYIILKRRVWMLKKLHGVYRNCLILI
jgi:hypothetical protein